MTTNNGPMKLTPARLEALLYFDLWTKREALCVLAGIDPHAETTHDQAAVLLERIKSPERHVQDAISNGRVVPNVAPPEPAFLEALPTEKREEFLRIVRGFTLYEEWKIHPAAIVRYALEKQVLFPDCPLTRAHLAIVADQSKNPSAVDVEQAAQKEPGAGAGRLVTGVGVREAAQARTELHDWSDITIRFLDEHKVQVRIKGIWQEPVNYAGLGFADKRTGKPRLAWLCLRGFAEKAGAIPTAFETRAVIEKRVQEIRAAFRSYFGLGGDPVPFIKNEGKFATAFRIETHRTAYQPLRD